MSTGHTIQRIEPGSFNHHHHWYPRVVNAAIHPMVQYFFSLSNQLIIDRYCHLHPMVKPDRLKAILAYKPVHYAWSGADLINVINARGKKQMVVIESNSCPSGQKSMPLLSDQQVQGGYKWLIENSFAPYCKLKPDSKKTLAVFYDKNLMENGGYAVAIADHFQRPVLLVPCFEHHDADICRVKNEQLEVLVDDKTWTPIHAAFRYVTQKPWNRLPVHTKTKLYNPIIACLAGGRNKLMASKAYDAFNTELKKSGLKIRTPETIRDVTLEEIPMWVKHFGGHAVVKVPYSNAGQGVYTIVSDEELEAFMQQEFEYSRFIVQSLIGNYHWTSRTTGGKYFHIGTLPNAKRQAFVFDLRMMVCATPDGFRPASIYSRRADKPLKDSIKSGDVSWDMLGTNLSHPTSKGEWTTDTHRLLMMDRRDFNLLGLGLDDMIEAFIQTVLSAVAIDKMAIRLTDAKGRLRRKAFHALNKDPMLLQEIMPA